MFEGLFWLPRPDAFDQAFKELKKSGQDVKTQLQSLQELSQHNLDFPQAANLQRYLRKLLEENKSAPLPLPRIKVALLSSTTLDHVLPSIEVGALRRGLLVDWYAAPFNQYRQEILDVASPLYAFKPDVVLLLLHAGEVSVKVPLDAPAAAVSEAVQNQIREWSTWWKMVSERTGAAIVQADIVVPPVHLFGHLDATLPGAPMNILSQINQELRIAAGKNKIHVLDVDALASRVGKYVWCAPALWHHAKQDIPLVCTPVFGDYVGRLLGAIRGMSRKCLVLDLDDTLWGGTIGEDGLENIEIGQGTGVGEAFLAFQVYVKQLKERGVILAVCSKNDEKNALLPFAEHPDMVLRKEDFALIVANWDDKAANIRQIASRLNIGLDSLVFFDNDAGERQLIRQMLPMVGVPEVPEDPAEFTFCLAESGYFEAGSFTSEDQARTGQYHAVIQQKNALESATDMSSFLKGLNMEMTLAPFDELGLQRIVQLINKSNQFNLTTRRATEESIRQLSKRPDTLTFQVRLKDRLVDHGMICVIIAEPSKRASPKTLWISTWLMSCRVLGRKVEQEVLNAIVAQARQRGYEWIQGEYSPTEKNGMVRDHYKRLGFEPDLKSPTEGGTTWWQLQISKYVPSETSIAPHSIERITL